MKIAEEGDNPEIWEVKDEHNIKFIENALCAEDYGVFTNWNVHFCELAF